MQKWSISDTSLQVADLLEEGFVISHGGLYQECYYFEKAENRFYHVLNDVRDDMETRKSYNRDEFLRYLTSHWRHIFVDFVIKTERKKAQEAGLRGAWDER
ncbi:MAG: hypothetical protein U0Y10_06975 [Spirosomataceae bacterium]